MFKLHPNVAHFAQQPQSHMIVVRFIYSSIFSTNNDKLALAILL